MCSVAIQPMKDILGEQDTDVVMAESDARCDQENFQAMLDRATTERLPILESTCFLLFCMAERQCIKEQNPNMCPHETSYQLFHNWRDQLSGNEICVNAPLTNVSVPLVRVTNAWSHDEVCWGGTPGEAWSHDEWSEEEQYDVCWGGYPGEAWSDDDYNEW